MAPKNTTKMHWNDDIIWDPIWLPLNSVIVFHKTWFSICFVLFRFVSVFFLHKIKILIFGWWLHSAKSFHLFLVDRMCTVSQSASHWSLWISCFLTLSPREFRIRLIPWNKHLFMNFTVFSLFLRFLLLLLLLTLRTAFCCLFRCIFSFQS